MPFDDYVEQRIFTPLGMFRSTFRQPLPGALKPLMSKGYRSASGEAMPFEMIEQAPAGSLSSTGADMAKFILAHLADGGPLLSPETAIHNALINGFMDRYFPGTPNDGAVDARTAATHARMMGGHYISSRRSASSFMRTAALISQPR